MVMRADIVQEMGEKNVLPWQLLAYDPAAPAFDTLIRDACMQVDPALSKIPNRLLPDTDRSEQLCRQLLERVSPQAISSAELCRLAAQTIAPGIANPTRTHPAPRKLELELTTDRLIRPPATIPKDLHRPTLPATQWSEFFTHQKLPDDLLLTIAGDGDPILHPDFLEILRAARRAAPLSIHVQTDLVSDPSALLAAISENLIDVLSINFPGHARETYHNLAGADLHPTVMANMEKLAAAIRPRAAGFRSSSHPPCSNPASPSPNSNPSSTSGSTRRLGPPRIPHRPRRPNPLRRRRRHGPAKRKPCRRLWERLRILADGTAVPCDQDLHAQLPLGNIQTQSIQELWQNANALRAKHAEGNSNEIDPCRHCREWHRP